MLRPLDFDPFEAKAAPTLRPLDFDPFARKGLDQMPGAGMVGGGGKRLTPEEGLDLARSIPAGAVKGVGMAARGLGTAYESVGRSLARPVEAGLRAAGMGDVVDALNSNTPWWLQPSEILKRPGEQTVKAGEAIGVPEERRTIGTDIGEGVGQLGGQITAALLSGGASATSSLAMLYGQGVDQMEQLRKEHAPDRQDAVTDTAVLGGGAITALTERYGLDKILNRIPPKIKNAVLRQLADVSIAGGIEAAQEVAENVLQRLTAIATFAPDASVLEGAGREAIAAGGAGAIARGLLNTALPGRQPAPTENAPLPVSPEIRAQTTADDINSPIPTELIEGGRQVVADAMGSRRSPVPSTDRPQESAPNVGGPTAPPPALEALPRAGGLPSAPVGAPPAEVTAPAAQPGVSVQPTEASNVEPRVDGQPPPVRSGTPPPPQPIVGAPVPQGPQPIPAPGPTVALPESVGGDQLVTRQDGTPWASETDARTARTSRPDLRGKAFEPVQVEGGWALRPLPAPPIEIPAAPIGTLNPPIETVKQPVAEPQKAPPLRRHEGSWVVVKKGTLEPVLETFEQKTADAINREKYDVLTAGDYLGRKNQEIRQQDAARPSAEPAFSRTNAPPPPDTRLANISRGKDAIERALKNEDEPYAVHRKDTGWIGVYANNIAHAIRERMSAVKQRMTREQAVAMIRELPVVLANGRLGTPYTQDGKTVSRNINYNGKTAVLRFERFGERETWVVTAYPGMQQMPMTGKKLSEAEAEKMIADAVTPGFKLRDDATQPDHQAVLRAPVSEETSAPKGSPSISTEAGPANRPPVREPSGRLGAATADNVVTKTPENKAAEKDEPQQRLAEPRESAPVLTDEQITQAKEELLADLKRMDPSGRLAMRLVKQINNAVTGQQEPNADGQYFRRLIEIAHQAIKDNRGKHVLNHEVIHALRDLGLFTDFEWRALVRAARSDKALMDRINRTYKDLPLGKRMEEAVAELFAQWSNGNLEAKGFLRTAMEKIKLVWEALSNLALGNRLTTARGVMRKVESGEVGARESRETRDAEPSFSRSEKPFYSALTRAAEKAKDSKATPGQWMGILKNSPGVKQDELDWSGIQEWLNTHAKPVTKEDLLAFLRANEVQVQEVVKGNTAKDRNEIKKQMREIIKRNDNLGFDTVGEAIQALIAEPSRTADAWEFGGDDGQKMNALLADYHTELNSTTKFQSYTLPGGENYRELLLTLPTKGEGGKRVRVYTSDGLSAVQTMTDAQIEGMRERGRRRFEVLDTVHPQGTFQQGHYDEANVVAHIRFNERTDTDGKRVLFIEEIQSDWHQKGRKQGYASKRTIEQIDADIDAVYAEAERREPGMDRESAGGWQAVWDTHPDLKVRHDALFLERGRTQAGGIPDAPFKTTWPELAFKRALRWAAENGFDSVAWTTGTQQAERYDLSKQIGRIEWQREDDGTYEVRAYQAEDVRRGEGSLIDKRGMSPEAVADTIGKELADRIVNSADTHGTIKGEGLRVGGEGMKGFYDQILPAFANKYGKKWGARVGTTNLDVSGLYQTAPDLAELEAEDAEQQAIIDSGKKHKTATATVHSLPITPHMRASVMEGQPMFSRRVPEVKERDTPPRRSDGTYASPTDPNYKAPKGTPTQQRAVNKAISADKPGGLWARTRETYDTIRNTIKDEIIWATADEFYGQRKLGKHIMPKSADTDLAAWMAAGMARHSAGQIEAFLRHGAPKWNGDDAVLEQDKETSPGFYEIVAPLYEKGLDRLFEGYAYARRVKTQNLIEDGREHNITAEERDSLVALENEFPEFKRIFNQIQTFKKAVLDAAQDMGLIDKEQRKVWEQADHVPFYRVAEEEDSSAGPFRKKGLAGQSPQIGRLTGGEERFVVFNPEGEVVSRHETKSAANLEAKKLGKGHTVESAGQPIVGIIENLVKNFSHLIDASMKNYAAVLAVDDALQVGIAEKVGMEHTQALVPRAVMAKALGLDPKQEDGIEAVAAIKSPVRPDNDVISIRRDGKVEFYRIKDKLLYRGVAGLHRAAMSWWTKPLVKLKNIFTRSITATPAFMARNFFRDSQSAWLQTPERGYNVLSEMAKSVKALGTRLDDPRVKAIMAAGGDTGWYQNAPEDVVKQLRQMEADGKATLIGLADVRKWWRTWERIGRASEIANRVVTYDATLKASGSKRKAAFAAADLLDFQRRGGAEWMQFLTAVTPFLNARIQGLYKLGRLATAGDKQARKALLTKAGMMIAFSTTLAILNAGDDEDDGYNDLPEYVKDGSWVINLKRMGIEGEGVPRFILIPKPFELGVLLGTVPERAVQLIAGNDRAKDTWDALERTVVDTFSINPLGNPLVKETVEQWANRDFFTGRPIVNQTLQFLPPEQQYDSGTSETAKGLGKMFDASPARIEHAIRGFTGDMGMFAVAVADAIMRGTGMSPQLPSERIDEMPVVKSFIRQDPARNSKWVERFYDIRNEAEEVVRGMNASRKAGDLEGARELRDENRGLLRVRKELDDRADTMAALNKQSREIKVRDDLTPDEKRRRLDAITRRRNEIAKAGAQRAETASER